MKRKSVAVGACTALLVTLLLWSSAATAGSDWHVTLASGETFTLTLNADKTATTVTDGSGKVIGSLIRDVNQRVFEVFDKDGNKLGTAKRINPDALDMLVAARGGDA